MKACQILAAIWSKFRLDSSRNRDRDCDRNSVGFRLQFDRNSIAIWSEFGPILSDPTPVGPRSFTDDAERWGRCAGDDVGLVRTSCSQSVTQRNNFVCIYIYIYNPEQSFLRTSCPRIVVVAGATSASPAPIAIQSKFGHGPVELPAQPDSG